MKMFNPTIAATALSLTAAAALGMISDPAHTATSPADQFWLETIAPINAKVAAEELIETAYYCQWVTLYDYWGNWVTVYECY